MAFKKPVNCQQFVKGDGQAEQAPGALQRAGSRITDMGNGWRIYVYTTSACKREKKGRKIKRAN